MKVMHSLMEKHTGQYPFGLSICFGVVRVRFKWDECQLLKPSIDPKERHLPPRNVDSTVHWKGRSSEGYQLSPRLRPKRYSESVNWSCLVGLLLHTAPPFWNFGPPHEIVLSYHSVLLVLETCLVKSPKRDYRKNLMENLKLILKVSNSITPRIQNSL